MTVVEYENRTARRKREEYLVKMAVTISLTIFTSVIAVAGAVFMLLRCEMKKNRANKPETVTVRQAKESSGKHGITPALPDTDRFMARLFASEDEGFSVFQEDGDGYLNDAASSGFEILDRERLDWKDVMVPYFEDADEEAWDSGSDPEDGDDSEDDGLFSDDLVFGEVFRNEEEPAEDDAYEGAPVSVWSSAKNVILDLDYNSDVDDVCALRLAAQMHSAGNIRLLAVGLSTSGDAPAKAAHGQLCYDGLGDIPIGTSSVTVETGSPYWDEFISAFFYEGNYVQADAVQLYKQKLRECAARNETIRFVTTGFVTNLAALLKDPEGYDLVRDHADSFYITGGGWKQGSDFNFVFTPATAEAIKYVVDYSPVPVVFSTNMSIKGERGDVMMCGASMMRKDTDGDDPVTRAFRAYERENNTSLSGGRFAWDPMCTWVACMNDDAATKTHLVPMKVYVDGSNGYNQFYPEAEDTNCKVIFRDSEDLGWYQGQLETWVDRGLR